jgi:hypothetical protein
VGGYVIDMGAAVRSAREALLVAVIGCALLTGLSAAIAQTGGAVQYPPASVGEDAQPPPPARAVPQSMSPRRIELGVSGPSERPSYAIRGVRPNASPTPPPTLSGN